MINGIDHIAIAVKNTEAALAIWRDIFGFPVTHTEIVNDGVIRLTHLSMGETDLQLVEPLFSNHPLSEWLENNGPGLHHLCFSAKVPEPIIENLRAAGLVPAQETTHQGIKGKWAAFLKSSMTDNVTVELTGEKLPGDAGA